MLPLSWGGTADAVKFTLFPQPWWVSLLILVPLAGYLGWRRKGLALTWNRLLVGALFAAGFGFVEAAVVVYLRAAIGLLPGYAGTLADVARNSSQFYQQSESVAQIPRSLLTVEVFREVATVVMLVTMALLSASRLRERWAMFVWMFAIWDGTYFLWLWATIRWPNSVLAPDVLFLIPVPWIAQVWFPLLISLLSVLAVAS
jgi:hypothetical protein